jgi:fibronectin type 3 domain-containing protein
MDRNNKMGKDSNIVAVEKMEPLGEETISIPPPAPTGLVALYTQKNIVLTWDEVRGMAIKSYRVYRSDGRGFFVVGETSTPAFTDENVEPSKIYYYKVLAVGAVAGPLSEEIKVSTEVH